MGQFILMGRYRMIFDCCHPLLHVAKDLVNINKVFPKVQKYLKMAAVENAQKSLQVMVFRFYNNLKWDLVFLHALEPTYYVFRCFATLLSHQVSRIVCLDAAMFGQILSHSVAVGMASHRLPRQWFFQKRSDQGGFDRLYWLGYSRQWPCSTLRIILPHPPHHHQLFHHRPPTYASYSPHVLPNYIS